MNELVLLNIVGGLWGLLLGASAPLSILYIIYATRKANQSGRTYVLHLTKRILVTALVWFFMIGILSISMLWVESLVTGFTAGVSTDSKPTIGFIIGVNVGLWGSIWLLIVGYRRGRRSVKKAISDGT
jgi:hypothetical protein